MTSYEKVSTPLGDLHLIDNDSNLLGVFFAEQWSKLNQEYPDLVKGETPLLKKARGQLQEYFESTRKDFDLPYAVRGTPFQKRVWHALATIPFGETITYRELAVSVASPKGVRAVGRAIGQNPLCVILPCHRVIGSDGSLTGYAGGLERKEFLLRLENRKQCLVSSST